VEVPLAIKQIFAFMKRDFFSWTTYRTAMMTQIVGILVESSAGASRHLRAENLSPKCTKRLHFFPPCGGSGKQPNYALVLGIQNQLNPWTLETILIDWREHTSFRTWKHNVDVCLLSPQLHTLSPHRHHILHAQNPTQLIAIALALIISAAMMMGRP